MQFIPTNFRAEHIADTLWNVEFADRALVRFFRCFAHMLYASQKTEGECFKVAFLGTWHWFQKVRMAAAGSGNYVFHQFHPTTCETCDRFTAKRQNRALIKKKNIHELIMFSWGEIFPGNRVFCKTQGNSVDLSATMFFSVSLCFSLAFRLALSIYLCLGRTYFLLRSGGGKLNLLQLLSYQ